MSTPNGPFSRLVLIVADIFIPTYICAYICRVTHRLAVLHGKSIGSTSYLAFPRRLNSIM